MTRFCFITFYPPAPYRQTSVACFEGTYFILPEIERKAILRQYGINPNRNVFVLPAANDRHAAGRSRP